MMIEQPTSLWRNQDKLGRVKQKVVERTKAELADAPRSTGQRSITISQSCISLILSVYKHSFDFVHHMPCLCALACAIRPMPDRQSFASCIASQRRYAIQC